MSLCGHAHPAQPGHRRWRKLFQIILHLRGCCLAALGFAGALIPSGHRRAGLVLLPVPQALSHDLGHDRNRAVDVTFVDV